MCLPHFDDITLFYISSQSDIPVFITHAKLLLKYLSGIHSNEKGWIYFRNTKDLQYAFAYINFLLYWLAIIYHSWLYFCKSQ